jgi:uncharacterized protein YidB (DUF937 family)
MEAGMNLMEMAANMLGEKLGIDPQTAITGLSGLFGGADGGLDLDRIMGLVQQGGLGDALSGLLGNGGSLSIDAAAVTDSLGANEVAEAAQTMGVSSDALAGGISDIIPRLIEQVSGSDSPLDAIGGMGGVSDLAKKLF